MAQIIDGREVARQLDEETKAQVAELVAAGHPAPGLTVILVGEDPASQVYVRNKHAQTVEAGMASFEHRLPADTSEADLLALFGKMVKHRQGYQRRALQPVLRSSAS